MDLQHTPTGVIVPHEAWLTYWLPMEEHMNQIKQEFERYKEDKDIKVKMDIDRFHSRELEDFGSQVIGQITFKDGSHTPSLNSQQVLRMIQKLVDETTGYDQRGYRQAALLTFADIEPKIKQMESLRKDINATHDKVQKKIETLPRIVRWLFKIKMPK